MVCHIRRTPNTRSSKHGHPRNKNSKPSQREVYLRLTSSPASGATLRGSRSSNFNALVTVRVEASLNGGLVGDSVSRRCLLGVLVHDLLSPLSCCAHTALLLHGLLLGVVVNLFAGIFGAEWWREAGADSLDHLGEPEQVEQVQSDVRGKVRSAEPERQVADIHESSGLADRVVKLAVVGELADNVHDIFGCSVSLVNCAVDILEDQDTAVVAPDETAAKEGRSEESTVDGLVDRAGEIELIAEPVNVQERARKLVQEEYRRIVVEERTLRAISKRGTRISLPWRTYESERKNRDSRDGMRKHTPAEDVHVSRAHVQIPKEVSKRETLQQTAHAIIAPDSLLPVVVAAPGLALFVEEDDIQAEGVDQAALHERDDMHIPANASATVEVRVGLRAEAGREDGRDDVRDEDVEGEGKQDLVGVQRKRRQAEEVGDMLESSRQGCGSLDGVWIEHAEAVQTGVVDERLGIRRGEMKRINYTPMIVPRAVSRVCDSVVGSRREIGGGGGGVVFY